MGSREVETSYQQNEAQKPAHEKGETKQKETTNTILKEGITLTPYSTTNEGFLLYMRGMEDGRKMELEKQDQLYKGKMKEIQEEPVRERQSRNKLVELLHTKPWNFTTTKEPMEA